MKRMAFRRNKMWKLLLAPCLLAIGIAVFFLHCEKGPLIPTNPKTATEILESNFSKQIDQRGLKATFSNFRDSLAESFLPIETVPSDERTGKCRLKWTEQLLINPERAVSKAEQFTRDVYLSTITTTNLDPLLRIIAEKLEAYEKTEPDSQKLAKVDRSKQDPIQIVTESIASTRAQLTEAFRFLSPAEIAELRQRLYEQTTGNVEQGHLFAEKQTALQVSELLEKIDRKALLRAASSLAVLADPDFLPRFAQLDHKANRSFAGVRGDLRNVIETPEGTILIGGEGPNVYQLDEMSSVSAVIDVGGDDIYMEGSTSEARPVLVILDAAGNDIYRGVKPGIQGGAILGASLLVDRSGNDTYSAADVAQGSALAGIGILVDYIGNDSYRGDRRVQGQAIAGIGMLIEREGDDHYRAALFGQGVGGPLGFGLLLDETGNDKYFAGGKYPDPYKDSPGFGAWSQGMGIGARGVANGGIGVLLDGIGNDVYQADYFSYGGGYWFGSGFARDFAGDDQRLGATTENFDGSSRSVASYLRWGIGFGCHYAAGFVFDDSGNDYYHGNWASIAYGWDYSIGSVVDFRGDDRYVCEGSGLAQAKNSALAILYDGLGNDSYEGKGVGEAEQHAKGIRNFSSSFAMLFDYMGKDRYPPGLADSKFADRGWAGGIFLDK